MYITRSLTVAAALAVLVHVPVSTQPKEVRKITVIAKKYEFEPSRIELKAGEPVELTFETEDTEHGFSSQALGLGKITFSKESPHTITFTPDRPGTYEFKCSKFCGLHHGRMKGEIVVTP
jgi:cytochrome c oxidase subunit II